jgi:hypothetical protein
LSASNGAVTDESAAIISEDVLAVGAKAVTSVSVNIDTMIPLLSSDGAVTDESAAIISEDVLAVGAEAVTSVYVSIDTGVLLSASNGAVTYTPSALGIVIEAAGKAVTDESAAIISEDVLAVGAEAVTSVFVNIDTMVLLSASNGAVTYTPSALGIVIEAAGKAAPLEHAGFGISVEASGAAVTDESSAIISEDVMTSSNGAVTSSSVAIVTAVPIRAAEDVTATGEAFLTALRPSLIASSAAVTNMLAVMESGVLLISAQFAVPEAINADLRYAAHLVSEHAAVTSSVANLLHAAILRVNGAAEPQYSAERIALPILAVNPIRVVHSKQLTRTISWVEDRFF